MISDRSNTERNIIAMGGGGFLMDETNHLLDDYILATSTAATPRICFVPTAGGDSQLRIDQFYAFFGQKNCTPSHLSLFRGHTDQWEAFLKDQDIIYVGGGNTRNMLVLWKEWGIDRIIRQCYVEGKILCGVSAGSICWFEHGLTDSIPTRLTKLDCLGILKGSNCPHFDGEPQRQEVYKQLIQSGDMYPGIGADDYCALHFKNEELFNIVTAKQEAGAYFITAGAGTPKIKPLKVKYLG